MNDKIDIIQIILSSGPVVKTVLLILLSFSIYSWVIIFNKRKLFSIAEDNNNSFNDIFKGQMSLKEIENATNSLGFTPNKIVFTEGHNELISIREELTKNQLSSTETKNHFHGFGINALDRSLSNGTNNVNIIIEKKLSILASIGSIAPFVGLFGTVWGIINSFTGIASKNATLDAVAPGIAEALVATAIGLAAAIPALWFYNHFNYRQEKLNLEMENFGKKFLNMVERTLIGDK